jgi:hypothetical protein
MLTCFYACFDACLCSAVPAKQQALLKTQATIIVQCVHKSEAQLV